MTAPLRHYKHEYKELSVDFWETDGDTDAVREWGVYLATVDNAAECRELSAAVRQNGCHGIFALFADMQAEILELNGKGAVS